MKKDEGDMLPSSNWCSNLKLDELEALVKDRREQCWKKEQQVIDLDFDIERNKETVFELEKWISLLTSLQKSNSSDLISLIHEVNQDLFIY